MDDYKSKNEPLSYVLYGITQFEPEKKLQITEAPIKIEDPKKPTKIRRQLPYVIALEVEIIDSLGESVFTNTLVSISRNETQQWNDVVE